MTDRCAGILIPLFSIRSTDDWGRGEFGGLVPMGQMALAMGHRLIQLLPIDEIALGETSPYSALSVFALDPIYVSIDLVPGIARSHCEAARAQLRGEDGATDLGMLRTHKGHLLTLAFQRFKTAADRGERDDFQQFAERNCAWLDDYAVFRALKDNFGGIGWESWPATFRRHERDALLEANRGLAEQIAMFKYVQYVAQQQWERVRTRLARMGVMLGGDLAFSPCRESVEVWAHQELFDLSRSVGAPPDAFSDAGQRWGLPMPDWERMRANNFEFLRMRVRHARELYDLLRIDHVVGLYRTYGYPQGDQLGGQFDPATEPAQRAQGYEIMGAVLEEAGPMQIVAEDLGLIPKFVRETLAALAIPGYKVLRWERDKPSADTETETSGAVSHSAPYLDPANYPPVSLATTGTHDTDTLVEWWATISPIERQRFLGSLRIAGANCEHNTLDDSTLDAILEAAYASPAQLAVTPMQDLFGWDARINFPGTISEANWSWRLPFDVDRGQENRRLRERMAKLRAICERTGRFRL
jgi:4-alpha-glucanotransferase